MYPPVNGTEFQCIASELSEYGYNFFFKHLFIISNLISILLCVFFFRYLDQYISNYLSHNPRGFPLSDIQVI
jgi:hypothetical protein